MRRRWRNAGGKGEESDVQSGYRGRWHGDGRRVYGLEGGLVFVWICWSAVAGGVYGVYGLLTNRRWTHPSSFLHSPGSSLPPPKLGPIVRARMRTPNNISYETFEQKYHEVCMLGTGIECCYLPPNVLPFAPCGNMHRVYKANPFSHTLIRHPSYRGDIQSPCAQAPAAFSSASITPTGNIS